MCTPLVIRRSLHVLSVVISHFSYCCCLLALPKRAQFNYLLNAFSRVLFKRMKSMAAFFLIFLAHRSFQRSFDRSP